MAKPEMIPSEYARHIAEHYHYDAVITIGVHNSRVYTTTSLNEDNLDDEHKDLIKRIFDMIEDWQVLHR